MKDHQDRSLQGSRRLDAALCCGLLLAMLLSPLAGFFGRCAEVRQEVLRLHILANSDSDADQAVKLRVRDAVLELFPAAGTLEEAEQAAEENLAAIEEAARRVLAEEGFSYPVKAELTRMYFGTRQYGDTTLPAGEYRALRLSLGDAAGKNWWCVMFPPICLPAAEPEEDAQAGQALRDIRALNQGPRPRLSFALVEWLEERKPR